MKHIAALLSAVMILTSAHAETAADKFGALRWPASPALIVDNEPELCGEVLSNAKQIFASDKPDMDFSQLGSGNWKVQEWGPVLGQNSSSPPFLGRLDLDLEGNGTKQIVVSRENEFGWRGYWNYAYVFQSEAALNAVSEKIKEVWANPPDGQYPSAGESGFGEQQYYPTAMSTEQVAIQTGNVWTNSALFMWHKRYYFFAGQTANDRLHSSWSSLFRLHGNGTVSEVCRIEISGAQEAKDRFLSTPGVESLVKVIRTIGEGGEDCGSMHSGVSHNGQASAVERRAAMRPWAVSAKQESRVSGNPYYVFDERTKKYLEYWSHDDLWTRREYQTFKEHIQPAIRGAAEYLVNEFALSPQKADSLARRLVDDLIGARFIIPSEFESSEESRDLYFGEYSIADALVEQNKDSFDALLDTSSSIPLPRRLTFMQLSGERRFSAALFYAVEWPYGMKRLLSAGAKPNEVNGYGKTPLMVAAHLNRPDAIKLLLEANADVNAVTHNVSSCSGSFERVNRSALTYAAENASPVVMKLLLEAGADPNILDSKGNGLDYYLANNPRLTGDERKLGIEGLSKISSQFSGPSFNCKDARTGIEKAICVSVVLRIFDLEIARAYEAFHARQGSNALTDQRNWIKHRNTLCSGNNLSEDCLVEVMRTRIRYLHNRLNEN